MNDKREIDIIRERIRGLSNDIINLRFIVEKQDKKINRLKKDNKKLVENGIGLGAISAMIVSYSANHSILWMLIHGFFNWFYIAYYILK